MALKGSQAGASALLGFLQSLQQGADQRNQQREQYLQQKQQTAESDRAFKLQQQQAEMAAAQAEREKTLFERNTADYNANIPVRDLGITQALGKPDVDADTITSQIEEQRTAKRAQLANLAAKIATTRGPARELLINEYDIVNGELENLPTVLTGRLSTVPGLKDPSKYIARYNGNVKPTINQGAGAGAGAGSQTTTTTTSTTGVTGAQGGAAAPAGTPAQRVPSSKVTRTDQFPLPAPTTEDIEAVLGAAKAYGLGGMGLNYYDMPDISYRTQAIPTFEGIDRIVRSGVVVQPSSVGLNAGKFIEAEMPKIQAALTQGATAGLGRHISAEKSLELMLGPDKSIWPVSVDDNDVVTPKTNFYATLTPEQRMRLNSALAPLLKQDDAILEQIKEARRARTDSLNTIVKDMEAYRDATFKVFQLKYDAKEAFRRAELTQTARTQPEALTVKQKLDDSNAIRLDVQNVASSDAALAQELGKPTAKIEDVLMGTESVSQATRVPVKIVQAFYQQRGSIASRNLDAIMVGSPANTIQQIEDRNRKMYGIKTQANNAAIEYIKKTYLKPEPAKGGRPNSKPVDDAQKAIKDWLATLR